MERDIVRSIQAYLRSQPDCFCFKAHGDPYTVAGIPDLICCVSGRFVAFEVKVPGGHLTKLQEHRIQQIRAAGGVAEVLTCRQQVEHILDAKSGTGGKS